VSSVEIYVTRFIFLCVSCGLQLSSLRGFFVSVLLQSVLLSVTAVYQDSRLSMQSKI